MTFNYFKYNYGWSVGQNCLFILKGNCYKIYSGKLTGYNGLTIQYIETGKTSKIMVNLNNILYFQNTSAVPYKKIYFALKPSEEDSSSSASTILVNWSNNEYYYYDLIPSSLKTLRVKRIYGASLIGS